MKRELRSLILIHAKREQLDFPLFPNQPFPKNTCVEGGYRFVKSEHNLEIIRSKFFERSLGVWGLGGILVCA